MERKLATVLFADLVGSTELGGSQDPALACRPGLRSRPGRVPPQEREV